MKLREFIAELTEYNMDDEVSFLVEFDDQEELIIEDFVFSKKEYHTRFGNLVIVAQELSSCILDVGKYDEMSTRLDELESENKDLHTDIEQLHSRIEVLEGS